MVRDDLVGDDHPITHPHDAADHGGNRRIVRDDDEGGPAELTHPAALLA